MISAEELSVQNDYKVPPKHWRTAILLIILLFAAFLRLVNLGQSPPGLNQDEAANGWNAYCLLKTGKDQAGKSWPVFYSRCLGSNRSTLYYYTLLPFQAVAGLNVQTTRLPNAVGGVLTVLLVYIVGARLFGSAVGLVAAALLAFNPWHLHLTRWGHEAGLCPLLGIVPLAMILWAKMPISDDNPGHPSPLLAGLAGAVTGICCYGYPSIRLFLPIFIFAIAIVTLPGWLRSLKTVKGALAIASFLFCFSVTFGPLAWQHIFHPEGIGRHSQFQKQLIGSGEFFSVVPKMASIYIRHFFPGFLFIRGDLSVVQTSPDVGQYHWYMLPLMILGFVFVCKEVRCSRAARVLLVFVIAYPVGDSLYEAASIHALRSAAGLCSLVLLASVGAVWTGRWLWNRNHAAALGIGAGLMAVLIGLNARYLYRFYGQYNRRPEIYHNYHVDLLEAYDWLRPRFDAFDAVFCTAEGVNLPYIISLVGLRYDPCQWFREPREFVTPGEFDLYTRYGKVHFMYTRSFIPALKKVQGKVDRKPVIFIVRPGQLGLTDPILRIRRADGRETLWICRQ